MVGENGVEIFRERGELHDTDDLELRGEMKVNLRVMAGPFLVLIKSKALKRRIDESKLMVFGWEKELVCKALCKWNAIGSIL